MDKLHEQFVKLENTINLKTPRLSNFFSFLKMISGLKFKN
jgi:hypothetical protein